MFLLVSKLKMIGMLLNVVHGLVQKKLQKPITKASNAFPNHFSLITMLTLNKFKNWKLTLLEDDHRLC